MTKNTDGFLLAAILLLFLTSSIRGGEAEYLLSLCELIVIIAGGVWIFGMIGRANPSFRSSLATLPAFLLLGALFVSTLLSPTRSASFKGLHESVSYVVLFLISLNLEGQTRKRVVYILIGISAMQAAVAVGQAVAGTERVAGTLTYPTYLVDLLTVGLSLAGALVLLQNGRERRRLLVLLPLSLLLFGAIFMTRARAGLVVIAASFVVLGIFKSKRTLGVLLVVLLAATLIPNPIRDRIRSAGTHDIYAMKRPEIWKQAIEISRRKPSAGVGMHNYVYYSRMTNFPVDEAVGRYAKVAKIAHNQYLQYAAETGFAGLGAFLLFVVTVLLSGLRAARSRDPVVLGSLAAWLALLAHSLVDNALYLPLNAYAFFVLGGFLCSDSEKRRAFRPPPRSRIYICVVVCMYSLLVLKPGVSAVFYRSALEKAECDDLRGAVRSCRTALAIAPGEAVYHDAMAKLFARRYDETRSPGYFYICNARFMSAIDSNPIDRLFWEDYADFTYEHRADIGIEKAYSDVALLLVQATKIDPYNPFLRRKLASVYMELGDEEKAERELVRILELEPNFHLARYMLAQVYASLGAEAKSAEQLSILGAKRLERLEERVQNDYEKRLIDFDWSLIPPGCGF
jgi:O-antigen ligase